MRRLRPIALVAALSLLGTAALVHQVGFRPRPAHAAEAEPYIWKNVRIDGGGFVPGVIFSRAERNLIYARTDIGGAYRWDQAGQRWIPLLDWVGRDKWGYNGVVSLAADPVDANRVYAAVGMYTNDWDPNNGAILRSSDRGATWQVTELPFKNGGNMPGRGMGERLAVDPRDNRNVYYAAEGGNGLWRSTDHGATWARVTAFPNAGNYVQDPGDTNGYLSQNQGLTWVTFDPSSRDVFVGVADKENPVYRSADGGATWSRVPGQPTGYLPKKGVVQDGNLYLATSDTGGPYDGAAGEVWRFDIAAGTWTDITPPGEAYYGYSGLTVDRQRPGTLMVATQISWWPDAIFFRSVDNGATWTRIWDFTSYPNVSKRYTMDISANPWLDFNTNPQPPESTPKLGWMNESVEIDPFDSDRLMYGTGATIYGTTQLTNWDRDTTFTIRPMTRGLEETNVLDLASPPSGAPLVSALGDIGGFVHTDLDAVPPNFHDSPSLGSNTSLDFAELNPQVFARVGNAETAPHIGISTDGGKNWYQGQQPAGVTGGGTIAVGADAGSFVWSPAGAEVHYSTTRGSSWTRSTGIPAGARVESDRVNPKIFYGYAGSTVYVSRDGGVTFAATAAPEARYLKAVPGRAGDVWLAGESGLHRSTDTGATFSKVTSVTSALNVAFGKAGPGRAYPAVFLVGVVDGVDGVFRSDDSGASWVRINDDAHRYGNMGDALAGDPRIWGRVYLGTNGRGILYADRRDGTSTTPPPTSPRPTTPPPTTPPPTTPPPTTPPPTTPPPTTGGCEATYRVTGEWGGGFQGEVTVRNGSAASSSWTLTWTYANGQQITQLWNGSHTQSGSAVTVRPAAWNGSLPPNGTTTVGFLGSRNATNSVPTVSCTRD